MAKARKKKRQNDEFRPLGIRVETATVENPNWSRDHDGASANPRFIEARVNIKESAVGTLAARKLIDKAQAEAALRFRRHWEATGGAGAQAMDYSRDKVDGGGVIDPIGIMQMQAARKLAEAERTLGERNYDLVRKVCGEGRAMTEIFTEKRDRLTATDNLRASLDDLCRIWGIAGTAPSKASTKHHPPSKDDMPVYNSCTTRRGRSAKSA